MKTLILIIFGLIASGSAVFSQSAGTIGVNDAPYGGINTTSTYGCYGGTKTILNIISPSGLTAPLTYTWQKKDGTIWVDIPSTNTASYNAPLNNTTYYVMQYRRKVQDANNTILYSNIFTLNECSFTPGSIGITSTGINCSSITLPVGYVPPTIKSTAAGYTNSGVSVTYNWQQATPSSNWVNATSPFVASFSGDFIPPLVQTTGTVYYRRGSYDYICDCNNTNDSYTQTVAINRVASNPFDPGQIVPNITNAVVGNTINFNASTLPTGGTAPYYYQWQDSTAGDARWNDISGATSSMYQTTLTAHKYFRRRAWSSNCQISFSTNQYLRTMNTIGGYVNSNVNTYTVNNVTGNYWFDISDGNGNVIASINPGNLNLGTVTLQMKHYGIGVGNIPQNNNSVAFMPRYFQISSSTFGTNNFPSTVAIRLYHLNSEFQDFKTKVNNSALATSNLRIAHYRALVEDCDMSNNILGNTTEETPTVTNFSSGFYLQFAVNSFSEFGTINRNTIVPLSWISFTGNLKGKQIELKWSIQNQIDNKAFEVMKSDDGKTFQTIATLPASNSDNYTYLDKNPLQHFNFYRIKQVDNNGKFSYSNTILIKMTGTENFTVYPNPIRDNFSVQSKSNGIILYRIIDANGQVYQSGEVLPNQRVSTSSLQNGIYFLLLQNEWASESFKIIKQ